ncbi:MAG: hypothetical protein SOU51_01110 [Collinsella sp.]|nr:hypothetical protein [Collinsella sp.]
MLDLLRAIYEEHGRGIRLALVTGLVVLGIAIAAGAALLAAKHGALEPPSGTGAEGGTPLTATQLEAVEAYGTKETEFVRALERWCWVGADATTKVTFADNAYTISSGNQILSSGRMAVTALDGPSIDLEAGQASDDATPTVASLLLDDGSTAIITITKSFDGGTGTLTLESKSLGGQALLVSSMRPVSEVSVSGLDGGQLDAIDEGASAVLAEHVGAYVRDTYPTATSASWDAGVTIDYEAKTMALSFMLDDARSTVLPVVYHMESDTCTFEGVM